MSKYNLACVYPFHIKATDGEEIMCYLTTKPEVPAEPPMLPPPLVVFHIKATEGEEILFYLTTKPEVPAVKGHIKATEGEEIMFYLTTKPEVPAVKGCQPEPPMPPPPLVVVIHGGPQARDYWGFNSMYQFSAAEVSK